MRDPYSNVKDKEYCPLSYTIGSIVTKDQKSAIIFRSKQASLTKATAAIAKESV